MSDLIAMICVILVASILVDSYSDGRKELALRGRALYKEYQRHDGWLVADQRLLELEPSRDFAADGLRRLKICLIIEQREKAAQYCKDRLERFMNEGILQVIYRGFFFKG